MPEHFDMSHNIFLAHIDGPSIFKKIFWMATNIIIPFPIFFPFSNLIWNMKNLGWGLVGLSLEIKWSYHAFDIILVTFRSIVGETFNAVDPLLEDLKTKKYRKIPKNAKTLVKHDFCPLRYV